MPDRTVSPPGEQSIVRVFGFSTGGFAGIVRAIDRLEAWFEAPGLVLLSESGSYWPHLRAMLGAGRIAAPRTHDARIAALGAEHGVRELWSADRDFSRFPSITVTNPLAG